MERDDPLAGVEEAVAALLRAHPTSAEAEAAIAHFQAEIAGEMIAMAVVQGQSIPMMVQELKAPEKPGKPSGFWKSMARNLWLKKVAGKD